MPNSSLIHNNEIQAPDQQKMNLFVNNLRFLQRIPQGPLFNGQFAQPSLLQIMREDLGNYPYSYW